MADFLVVESEVAELVMRDRADSGNPAAGGSSCVSPPRLCDSPAAGVSSDDDAATTTTVVAAVTSNVMVASSVESFDPRGFGDAEDAADQPPARLRGGVTTPAFVATSVEEDIVVVHGSSSVAAAAGVVDSYRSSASSSSSHYHDAASLATRQLVDAMRRLRTSDAPSCGSSSNGAGGGFDCDVPNLVTPRPFTSLAGDDADNTAAAASAQPLQRAPLLTNEFPDFSEEDEDDDELFPAPPQFASADDAARQYGELRGTAQLHAGLALAASAGDHPFLEMDEQRAAVAEDRRRRHFEQISALARQQRNPLARGGGDAETDYYDGGEDGGAEAAELPRHALRALLGEAHRLHRTRLAAQHATAAASDVGEVSGVQPTGSPMLFGPNAVLQRQQQLQSSFALSFLTPGAPSSNRRASSVDSSVDELEPPMSLAECDAAWRRIAAHVARDLRTEGHAAVQRRLSCMCLFNPDSDERVYCDGDGDRLARVRRQEQLLVAIECQRNGSRFLAPDAAAAQYVSALAARRSRVIFAEDISAPHNFYF